MAIFPWVNTLVDVYAAGDLVEIQQFPEVLRVLKQFLARPAVTRGRNIPSA
jgi:GST-like protein